MMKSSAKTSAALFGAGATACNLSELARATGLPVSTLSRYKRQPEKMPLSALRMIARARGLQPEEIERIIKG